MDNELKWILEIICKNIDYEIQLKRKNNIIKEVKEEIKILESNCDISEYQAQKIYHLLDKE